MYVDEDNHSEITEFNPHEDFATRPQDYNYHFNLFLNHFVNPFPIKPYHLKQSYTSGFIQKKTKKDNPLPLFDPPVNWKKLLADITYTAYRPRTEAVERHLDPYLFANYKAWKTVQPGWLGLVCPKMFDKHLIDIDNQTGGKKNTIKVITNEASEEVVVTYLTLDHLQRLKRIYDHFPERVWCISSQTLGVHAWKLHEPQNPKVTVQQTRQQLQEIDEQKCEVHPCSDRCLRLPFGLDYITITPERVITFWTQQLDYILTDARTPTFEQITTALIQQLERQWRKYRDWASGTKKIRGKWINNDPEADNILKPHETQLQEIRDWMENGFIAKTVVPTITPVIHSNNKQDICTIVPSSDTTAILTGDTYELANKQLYQTLEQLAVIGLVPTDQLRVRGEKVEQSSLAAIITQFALVLWHDELHEMPENTRGQRITNVLYQWVLKKHNGCCSRLLDPTEQNLNDIHRQISNIVKGIKKTKDHNEHFENVRKKKAEGNYIRVIRVLDSLLLGLLNGVSSLTPGESEEKDLDSSPLGLLNGVSGLTPDERLSFVNALEPHKGRNKVHDFALKTLEYLKCKKGKAVFSQELGYKLLSYKNPTRLTTYLKIMIKADLIVLVEESSYKRHRANVYALTPTSRVIMNLPEQPPIVSKQRFKRIEYHEAEILQALQTPE